MVYVVFQAVGKGATVLKQEVGGVQRHQRDVSSALHQPPVILTSAWFVRYLCGLEIGPEIVSELFVNQEKH